MYAKISLDFCNNHLGDFDILKKMMELAAENGVDIIKFQLYNPDKLNPKYPNYSEYKCVLDKCRVTEGMISYIFDRCGKLKLHPMFTIFTKDRLASLKDYVDYSLKIASPDMLNTDLIDACLKSKKPVWVSTGMHTKNEIAKIKMKYNSKVNFMYCISRYPTLESDIDYNTMLDFDGFSDHTKGVTAAKKAIAKNILLVEKHFTLSRYLPGKDHAMSMTPEELEELMSWKKYRDSIETYKNRWVS